MPRPVQAASAIAVIVTFISLSSFLSTAAQAGTIRSDRPDSLYTNLANEQQFDPVGRFDWNESGSGFLASGTLISNEWVLTAAHVVDGVNGFGSGISNLRFEIGGRTVAAEEWIPHPNWAPSGGEDNLFAGWDIGLVRLSTPVLDVGPAELYTDRDELGQVATIVGFGATGTGETGATQSAGTRRAGQNVIDAVGRNVTPGSVISPPTDRLVTIDFDQPGDPSQSTLGSPLPLDLEYLTAPGDSGGGLFLDTDDGVRLAAVTSLGSSLDPNGANSDYGDRASFTRVSSFLDFIQDTTGLDFFGPDIAGDYNGDGVVNADDYDPWRQQFGLTGLNLTADGNGDGRVDSADYVIWRDSLVAAGTTPAVVAIPEPSGLAFALIGLVAVAGRSHSRAA